MVTLSLPPKKGFASFSNGSISLPTMLTNSLLSFSFSSSESCSRILNQ
jgi:hypothetical protein